MKVINYEVATLTHYTLDDEDADVVYRRGVVVTYADEHGREQAPMSLSVNDNDSDEDILRQCEAAIAPPVDNRTLVRKAKDAVDIFFDVCK